MPSKRKQRKRSRKNCKKQKGRGGNYKRKQRGYGNINQIGKGRIKNYFRQLAAKASGGLKRLSKSSLAKQAANTAKNILIKTGENIVRGQDPKLAIRSGAKQFGETVGANLLNSFVKSM